MKPARVFYFLERLEAAGVVLNKGILLEYKCSFLDSRNSEFKLRRFLQDPLPDVAGAQYIRNEASVLLDEFDSKNQQTELYNFHSYQAAKNKTVSNASKKIKIKVELPEKNDFKMINVKGGDFIMGKSSKEISGDDEDEKSVHVVKINSFKICKYEITNSQYAIFLNESFVFSDNWINFESPFCKIYYQGSEYKVENGFENHPVVEVSWFGAEAFCNHYGKRLPTEAEWEYAAKGGSETENFKYSGSNEAEEVAWYGENSLKQAQRVGVKKSNELGLHDMSGNVWEWCFDGKRPYSKEPQVNPQGSLFSSFKAVRGGSWGYNQESIRITNRGIFLKDFRSGDIGWLGSHNCVTY